MSQRPNELDDDQVRLAVIQRLSWIKRQQRASCRPPSARREREMVTGESHYVWGVRRRAQGRRTPRPEPHFETDGDRLVLYAPAGYHGRAAPEQCSIAGTGHSCGRVDPRPDRDDGSPIIGVSVPKWSIRRMKTKWGSCNRETGHIWFNVELAKKHPECLEYIVVHEMTHHLERGHGERFAKLMDTYLPDWRSRRDQLNSSPLPEEDWSDRG
ncbi:MAG: SprT-like domain-containing protein [Dermatophilaceae bacterium]